MGHNIFFGNLPTWVTADDIKSWLDSSDLVCDAVRVIRDFETQESKGYAFVEAPNDEEMNAIIRRFNRAPIDGKLLRAKAAHPKGERDRNQGSRQREVPARRASIPGAPSQAAQGKGSYGQQDGLAGRGPAQGTASRVAQRPRSPSPALRRRGVSGRPAKRQDRCSRSPRSRDASAGHPLGSARPPDRSPSCGQSR